MITKSNDLNRSNNESIEEIAAVNKTSEQSDSGTNSSETFNKQAASVLNTDPSKAVVLDSNYIESKIKSLLNQGDDKCPLTTAKEKNFIDSEDQKQVRIVGILSAEDSCNAVDHKISSGDSGDDEHEISTQDLSFNGKIASLSVQLKASSSQAGSGIAVEEIVSNDKVCKDKLNESFEVLTKENSSLMIYNNEKSPDLFAENDNADSSDDDDSKTDTDVNQGEDAPFKLMALSNISCVDPIDNIERMVLKRMQSSLSGILPPPSVTYSQIDFNQMLNLYKEHEARLCYRNDEIIATSSNTDDPKPRFASCLSKPTHTPSELFQMEWPELLKARAHGLYYNRSVVTEKIELLGLKFVDRYIGAETSSTFNVSRSPSAAKKRNLRLKMLNQSPGSRLSHLARRRAVFSSANLLNSSGGSATVASPSTSSSQLSSNRLCNRQILLESKKSDNRRKNKGRTPKRRATGRRRTPSRRKTPGSSSKKRTLTLPLAKQPQSIVSRETSKRVLFQSPPNGQSTKQESCTTSSVRSCVANRVQKSKRALFSPPKRAHRFSSVSGGRTNLFAKESLMDSQRYGSANNIDMLKEVSGEPVDANEPGGKRKRSLDDDDSDRLSKNARKDLTINEEDLTPRSLKFARSQSFCVSSQNLNTKSVSETAFCGKTLFRACSEVTFPDSGNRPVTVLTENHKKKLLWAVSQALQIKQITVKHERFKQCASNLARVVKRLFLEFNDQSVSSTSEKLLRLANKHVYDVIQGRSVDDIYLKEKTRIMNVKNTSKLHGYIAPQEYEQRQQLVKRSASTSLLISENSIDTSLCASSSQQLLLSQSSIFSQSSEFLNQLSQSSLRQSGASNAASCELTTSDNTALRENIDSEQRHKSAQKQVSFSGKDQKNLSPYADNKGGGAQAKGTKLLVGAAISSSSILKAKRQISFE
ncbi:uncharacterized protein LOC131691557 [Topomyia yanbarensis]|uniref:uncharacterized protein LOC131691557 n=1 Tax=Topomyia yanbarensis TaxID=2498891 RepID=UPI00273CE2F3|nr:uncharacterized protein LOC131691557 [Topomyia yanbarensis]XP_058834053.1 uncharacterized protein LOC131691557 [Topomyia yanbarensis]